jgi:N6-L-threonylcarbamoyladenine synthase
MILLGIETSCDETAAAVIRGEGDNVEVLSKVILSQIEIHKKYGGVVPEVAAREHIKNIIPVIDEALKKAKITPPTFPLPVQQAGFKKERRHLLPLLTKGGMAGLDAIAVTTGPGLVTSLLVGVETAKSLALAWNLPLVAVNHIEGHIYANFIRANSKSKFLNPKQIPNSKSQISKNIFPAIILTVSGGHTMLVLMKGHGKLELIGDTLDDAAGEAFDKAAAMLGLGYPGGPAVAVAAAKFPITNYQSPNKSQIPNQKSKILLPRPMINSKDFNFSFSGLKTALLYAIRKDVKYSFGKLKTSKSRVSEYAHEFQQAVIDVLVAKTVKAAKKYDVKTVMLSGGVSANRELRKQMEDAVNFNLQSSNFKLPELQYTTDNAAMIASAGYFKARRKKFALLDKVKVDCNYEI